ncbi:MAG: hypothetical protein JJE30_13915 [Desulfuromonadales bacterium]|nr:hypothetical protein [Desulfuromonadales bacterium]
MLTGEWMTFSYRPLWTAIKRAWPIWVAVAGVALCWIIAYFLAANLTKQILYAGAGLQFIGLATVAIGVRELRKQFKKPSMLESVRNWFQLVRSAFRKLQHLHADCMSSASMILGGGLAKVEVHRANPTLEMRIEELEKGLISLREEHGKSISNLENNVSRVESLVHDENNKRQANYEELRGNLENVAVGGIHLELVGLLWMLLGMLGTSIQSELAKLF